MADFKIDYNWYNVQRRLKNATAKQRKNYQIIGNGTGIYWTDIDEDLSVEGIIEGQPSRF